MRKSSHRQGSGAARSPKPHPGLSTATSLGSLENPRVQVGPNCPGEEAVQAPAARGAGALRRATALHPHLAIPTPVVSLTVSYTPRPEATLAGRGPYREDPGVTRELGSSPGSALHHQGPPLGSPAPGPSADSVLTPPLSPVQLLALVAGGGPAGSALSPCSLFSWGRGLGATPAPSGPVWVLTDLSTPWGPSGRGTCTRVVPGVPARPNRSSERDPEKGPRWPDQRPRPSRPVPHGDRLSQRPELASAPGSLCSCPPGLTDQCPPGGGGVEGGGRGGAASAPSGRKDVVGLRGGKSPQTALWGPSSGMPLPTGSVHPGQSPDMGHACKSGQAAGPGAQPVFGEHGRQEDT